MDLKDDEKSLKFREQQNFASRYFESNAGHLFVNNVNPFSSIENYGGDVKENLINKRSNDEFIDLYDNTNTKPPTDTPSKAYVNEFMKKYPYNNMFMSETYEDVHEALIAGNQPDRRSSLQPTMSMSATMFDTQYITSCSRGSAKSPRHDHQVRFEDYNEDNNRHRAQSFSSNEMMTDAFINEKGRAEKTTYCRPLFNMYNQEFVYKTMQRNARLQKLVKKLVIAREREKQRESWNNYINDLKNKHRYYSNEPSRISPQYVPEDINTAPELIDDYYNTRFSWRQSNPCQHLLQDFYGAHNNATLSSYNRCPYDYNVRPPLDARTFLYESNRYCYPTSSQANLIRLNTERVGNNYSHDWRSRPSGRFFRGNTIVVDKDHKDIFDKVQGTSRPNLRCTRTIKNCDCKNKMCSLIRSSSIPIQTDCSLPLVNEEDDKDDQCHQKQDTFKDKFKRVTENIARLKSKVRKSDDDTRRQSLAKIEGKIDGLINSINTIMVDMKSKKKHYRNSKSASVSCRFLTTSHNNLNRNKSDPYGMMKNDDYLCGMLQNSSRSLTISEIEPNEITRHRESSISRMDKILLEEMKKSNKVKRDIEELLNLRNDRNCSVQITFDIPTKERSTEVTDSLSKAKLKSVSNVVVEEIPSEPTADGRHTQMTIAVNTDPLGLLALLRVSTETIKQFLSYMPNLNYNSYLSMLQLPSKRCVSHYICNICGAAFGRPSQLSDHIEQHNLGRTRDCCVCRHSLDLQPTHIGLFACRYCGQRFTRAYCCELHQQSCAKRFGRSHDINSGHILLS